jgi:hypothetical protein
VDVKTSPKFEAGAPRLTVEDLGGTDYSPAPDGQRFLVEQEAAAGRLPPITVVLNWQAEMKK